MKTIEWVDGKVRYIDQTKLPLEEVFIETADYRVMAADIKELVIRGAPAIGVAAGFAVAIGALEIQEPAVSPFMARLEEVASEIRSTRPTAVNLFWGVERAMEVARVGVSVDQIRRSVLAEARRMAAEDEDICHRIGANGSELIQDGFNILTHCNAGALACVDYGTALGVIRAAHDQGKKIHVFVDETRPLLQGARLTAFELTKSGIPMTLITDNMAGHIMRTRKVNCVVVGADRIAANGDTANKIGTYSVSILAKEHGIPFYVAAPTSTIDLTIAQGDDIVIEERREDEVTTIQGKRIAPYGVKVANPAFDFAPSKYIAAIITEHGIVRSPFEQGLREVVSAAKKAIVQARQSV
ncbi:MAG: S-methyl-5-thioribose-1-phosphate isomerase [Dehalococcoidia bacterium]|nr:S-methyl-5-thioribose-1-phosphate isomerase [Dehalococcoidia bacterium]